MDRDAALLDPAVQASRLRGRMIRETEDYLRRRLCQDEVPWPRRREPGRREAGWPAIILGKSRRWRWHLSLHRQP
jgi:hypothetical protein